jgi:hypothetical protein
MRTLAHRQMSMPKPVCPNMATATPSARRVPGVAQAAQEQHAGLLKVEAQSSATRIRLPAGAARKVSASVRRACIPDTYAASGPETGTWNDPDPRRRSSRGSGAQNRPARQWRLRERLRAVPSQRPSWRYGLRRTCRLVTGRSHRPRSTWPNQARLAVLAVTHRYSRTHCLWLEQFQIADSARLDGWPAVKRKPRRFSSSAVASPTK